jgi:ribose-phosphate pyrophosphokinase
MKPVILAAPGNEAMAAALAEGLGAELGHAIVRRFPDRESYVRIETLVGARDVILVCTMDRPDEKFLALSFLAATARDLGAARVGLVCPYLPYMRQDKRFRDGEGITSVHFADAMSRSFDWIVTVDPHLHRRRGLSEIYRVPVVTAHAAPLIAAWIRDHVPSPVVVGPDQESAQWVGAVAAECGAAHLVLDKHRTSDRKVEISHLNASDRDLGTPVVLDDIISTGQTMAEAVKRLREAGYSAPYCVAVHGIFADRPYEELIQAGAHQIVTCNTVLHSSNGVDVSGVVAEAAQQVLGGRPT